MERLAPYVQPIEPQEHMVSADPVRMFLIRWMIETGDPIEVVAKGFDLDCNQIKCLLNRQITSVGAGQSHELRTKLHLD